MAYTLPAQIRVNAQPYLNLRREPVVRPGNVVGRLADGSTWPVVGVAREDYDEKSDVLWVHIESTDASTGKKTLGFCSSAFVNPKPDPLPRAQRVLPEDGLNLRSSPVFDPRVNNKIVTMQSGSMVPVVGGAWENFDPKSGKWWYVVEYQGRRGYAYSRFLGESTGVQPGPGPTPPRPTPPQPTPPRPTPPRPTPPRPTPPQPTPGRPSPAWKFGVCLAGVGNADQNVWQVPTFPDAIKSARVEAVKLVPLNDLEQMNRVYEWFRSQGIAFVMVRLTWKPDPAWANLPAAARITTAVNSFVQATRGQLEFAHANGVRYFEVHNEPNIPANPTDPVGDGLGTAWMGPEEFADWFGRVVDELRKIRPNAFYGFPGLAPRGSQFADFGGGLILVKGQKLVWNTDQWLSVCKPVILAKADWVGAHCYWQFDGGGLFGIENPDSGGMYWQRYKARFPGKLLFITEFSNNGGAIPYAEKGRQYAKYISLLRREKSIGAAFGYAIFWASDPNREGWVFVNEAGKWRVTEIPGAMGAALAANPTTANPVVVSSPAVWA